MLPPNWNSELKKIPVMNAKNPVAGLKRALSLSSSDTETGVNSSRKNTYGHQ